MSLEIDHSGCAFKLYERNTFTAFLRIMFNPIVKGTVW